MTEHPGDTRPGAEHPPASEAGPDAGPDAGSDGGSDGAEAPSEASSETSAAAAGGEEPDALGHVEEQTRLPEEESTVAQPGEALEELLPALAATGHDGVDDALATLDEMAEKSVHDHVDVFDAVHDELRRTLDQAADQ